MLDLIKKYNLSDNILYLGYQSRMVWFYSILDIFVIPSHWEPMGLTELEAQAMRIPVIASDIVGSAYEYIKDGENGFVFSVSRPDTLKLIIEKISNNPSIIEDMKKKVFFPPRIEEEAFMVESIYRKCSS